MHIPLQLRLLWYKIPVQLDFGFIFLYISRIFQNEDNSIWSRVVSELLAAPESLSAFPK